MRKIIFLVFFIVIFSFNSIGQRTTYKDLVGGKWKAYNLPDSAFAIPGDKSKVLVVNVMAKFVDSSIAEVSYNGFYFKSQSYKIDTSTGLIYINVVPNVENVGNSLWILKYINKETIKLQENASYMQHIKWDNNETWYNTNILTFYKE